MKERTPSQQRKLEHRLDNGFAFAFAAGIGLLGISLITGMADFNFNRVLRPVCYLSATIGTLCVLSTIIYGSNKSH